MAAIERMPAVVADAVDAVLSRWLISEGESVRKGTPIAEIETDKANVEIEAHASGTATLLVEQGTTVEVGAGICAILAEGEGQEAVKVLLGESAESQPDNSSVTVEQNSAAVEQCCGQAETEPPTKRIFASPLARRLAAEHDLDLKLISGRGPRGRIISADVRDYLSAHQVMPIQQISNNEAYTDQPVSRMRRAIANRLTESKTTIPHFYVTVDIEVDELLRVRQSLNEVSSVKITVNDLIVKSVAAVLTALPQSNVEWREEVIRQYQHADIAIAVATPTGLVTPVVRSCDQLGLQALAMCTKDMAEKARANAIKQHDIEGGTITISNLGMYGVKEFSAILNPPHSIIIAVGAAQPRPVVKEGQLTSATVMTVTGSFDHRVIDGALGAQFMQRLKAVLEAPALMLI